jgi:hypothetical protein
VSFLVGALPLNKLLGWNIRYSRYVPDSPSMSLRVLFWMALPRFLFYDVVYVYCFSSVFQVSKTIGVGRVRVWCQVDVASGLIQAQETRQTVVCILWVRGNMSRWIVVDSIGMGAGVTKTETR